MVRLKQVLSRLPGITKADLQYWEARGYIKPIRIAKQRIERRDYGPAIEKIELMWQFYEQGLSPEDAAERAEQVLRERKTAVGELSLASFFNVVRVSPTRPDVREATLAELGTLSAPGGNEQESRSELFFASVGRNLAMAAREMAPYLIGTGFIIIGDELGALIVGACSTVLSELQPDQLPLLLQMHELNSALKTDTVAEGCQGALVFGFLKDLRAIENVLEELTSKNFVLRWVLTLASELEEDQVQALKKRNVALISLFDRDDVIKLLCDTEQKKSK